MIRLAMDATIVEKLRQLLANEDDDAVVRIRETKTGSACKAKTVLRLSIDFREDEDVAVVIDGIPVVMHEELVDQYGRDLSVTFLEDDRAFEVHAVR